MKTRAVNRYKATVFLFFLFQVVLSHAQKAVVGLPVMNIVYVGQENPVEIAVAGYKKEQLLVTISPECEISDSNATFIEENSLAFGRRDTLTAFRQIGSYLPAGKWTSFYGNGNKKEEGNFAIINRPHSCMLQHTNEETGLVLPNYIATRKGVWTYYNEDGSVHHTITYPHEK